MKISKPYVNRRFDDYYQRKKPDAEQSRNFCIVGNKRKRIRRGIHQLSVTCATAKQDLPVIKTQALRTVRLHDT